MKKILSLILVCCVLFSAFACQTSGFADETDGAYVADFLKSIGIELKVSEPTTRGQFIYNIMQLIKAENTGGSSAYGVFADISADDYFYGAVLAALSLGIISPSSQFRPDDAVTVAEACKIMVCALGMGFEAEVRGGYPTGYLSLANSCRLTGDLPGSTIGAAQMYSVVQNFLDARPYIIDSVGASHGDASYISNKTALEYYHDITRFEGVVTASSHTGMYLGSASVPQGYAAIDDVLYKTSADVSDCIAKNSEVYVRSEGSKTEIVYIRPKDNKIIKLSGEDILSVSGEKISYTDESGRDRSVSLASAPAYIYNGKANPSLSASDLIGFGGTVELVSNDGDGKTDAVILRNHELVWVSGANAYEKSVCDKNGIMKIFDSEDSEVTVIKNGRISSFEDIGEDDLIKLYSSSDGMVHRLEIVSVNNIEGVLTSVSKDEKTVMIGDVQYGYEDYFEANYSSQWTLGTAMSFYLTDSGKVFALAKPSDSDTLYGYFIAAKKESGMNPGVTVKVLCEDGSISEFEIAPKVIIDGKVYKVTDITADGDNATVKPGLVRYRINSDGLIRLIDTAQREGVVDKSLSDDNNLTLFKYPSDKYSSIWYIQNTSMFAPYFKVTSSTKVFVVSDDETLDDKYRYTTHTSSYFNTNRYASPDNLLAYNVSTVGEAEAIVVKGGSGIQAVGTSSSGGVVISANKGMDAEGTECIIVTLYSKNNYVRLYLSDPMLINSLKTDGSQTDIPLTPGDYVRYTARNDDHITAVSKDFDYSTKEVKAAWENHSNGIIFYYGDVYDKGNNLVSVAVENNPKFEADINDASQRYNVPLPSSYIVYDSQTKTAYKGTMNDIVTYLNNADNCSKILIRNYNGTPNDAVIYK